MALYSAQEDQKLSELVGTLGASDCSWRVIAKKFARDGKSCRARYLASDSWLTTLMSALIWLGHLPFLVQVALLFGSISTQR